MLICHLLSMRRRLDLAGLIHSIHCSITEAYACTWTNIGATGSLCPGGIEQLISFRATYGEGF